MRRVISGLSPKLREVAAKLTNWVAMYSAGKERKDSSVVLQEPLLIVSLTSYPKRLNIVHLTIESLMKQTKKPDKIILWLAKEELSDEKIPQNILKLKFKGLEIKIVDENLKSYNKLVYSIEHYPTSNIITCDDDMIYDQTLIEGIYKKHKRYPKCIVAYRCTKMQKNSKNKLAPYLEWKGAINNRPSHNLFATGVGGVLYPPKSLHSEVNNKELFSKLSPHGDDIWFKAMALLNNTKVVMVNKKTAEKFTVIAGSQDQALWHINNGENKNDEQLKNVFDHFDLYKYI